MDFKPCIVKTCPALASNISAFGYCPIHHNIATTPSLLEKALKGEISSDIKAFANDVRRGVYPKGNVACW